MSGGSGDTHARVRSGSDARTCLCVYVRVYVCVLTQRVSAKSPSYSHALPHDKQNSCPSCQRRPRDQVLDVPVASIRFVLHDHWMGRACVRRFDSVSSHGSRGDSSCLSPRQRAHNVVTVDVHRCHYHRVHHHATHDSLRWRTLLLVRRLYPAREHGWVVVDVV